MSSLENITSGDAGDTDTRKLVILGTTEASLEQHFSQIGPLQVTHEWQRRRILLCTSRMICQASAANDGTQQ